MDFKFSDDQEMIRHTAKRFSEEEILPVSRDLENPENRELFFDILRKLAELGFMGMNVSEKFGGSNAGVIAFSLAVTEVARSCASVAVAMSVNNLVAEVLQLVGNSQHKEKHIPSLCAGKYLSGAFCLSEAGAGSDPSSMETHAEKNDSAWIINGEKMWISNADCAGVFVVWAKTQKNAPKGQGISCFLVEKDNLGVQVGKSEKKMGQIASSTNTVYFNNCIVKNDALLGQENKGYSIAMKELVGGRIGIASLALGIGQAALEYATKYITERKQFGEPIANFQGPQFYIAERFTEMEAAKLLTLKAAWEKENSIDYTKSASMAKFYATEWANRACYTALQLMGGIGYTEDSPIEKMSRDARVTTIYEGTSEIQKIIIAKEIIKSLNY